MTARIDRYAVFFRNLDLNFLKAAEINQESLFQIFGAEGLRRSFQPVTYLIRILNLNWSSTRLEEFIEGRRIEEMIAELGAQCWHAEFVQYRRWLELPPKKRTPLTIRIYLNAVRQLMAPEHFRAFSDLNTRDIDSFLKRHRGHSASLTPFIRFLNETQDSKFVRPTPKQSDPTQQLARAVKTVRRCLDELQREQPHARKVAFAATLLSVLYRVPRKDVLSLPSDSLVLTAIARDSTLIVKEQRYAIDPTVASLLGTILPSIDGDEEFLFPGRSKVAPRTGSSVWHHVRS